MSKRILSVLLGLNLCLLGAQVLVNPATAVAQDEIIVAPGEGQGYDCCKSSNGGEKFCCDQCCAGGENCDSDADCRV
jgi:hypothetical protein